MSMYGMVFGNRGSQLYPLAKYILGEEYHIGRYRDMWFEAIPDDSENCILAIYTRNGGGNREEYAAQITSMQSHPAYVEDADDEFDSTYATFRFKFSFDQLDEIELGLGNAARERLVERVNMSDVWLAAIERLKQ